MLRTGAWGCGRETVNIPVGLWQLVVTMYAFDGPFRILFEFCFDGIFLYDSLRYNLEFMFRGLSLLFLRG